MSQWLAIDAALELNHKVVRFRASLRWSDNDLVARLYRLWAWVRRDRPDGILSRDDIDSIPAIMDREPLEGDVVTALLTFKLIEPVGDGSFIIHDWLEKNGGFVRNAKRMREFRYRARTEQAQYKHVRGEQEQYRKKKQESKALPREEPPVLSGPDTAKDSVYALPTNVKDSFFGVSALDIEGWKALYPAVDVDQQIRKMIGWLDSHPTKRKTARGMKAFVNGWLGKEQDRGGSTNGPADQVERGPESAEDQVSRWKRAGML